MRRREAGARTSYIALLLVCAYVLCSYIAVRRAWEGRGLETHGEPVPRLNEDGQPRNYLTRTVSALMEDRSSGTVQPPILVVSNNIEHQEFDALRLLQSDALLLRTNTFRELDPLLGIVHDPDDSYNPSNTPGHRVRQQTLDIAALIRITRQSFSEAPPRFVLLMEDDFVICERGLEAIQYAIDKMAMWDNPHFIQSLSYNDHWSVLRVSYGFNGIIVRWDALVSLGDFLRKNYARLPPDHLIVEYNLLLHIGTHSSLRTTGLELHPQCWQLLSPMLHGPEEFDDETCWNDDVSPCVPPSRILDFTDPFSSTFLLAARDTDGAIVVSMERRDSGIVWIGPDAANNGGNSASMMTVPSAIAAFIAPILALIATEPMRLLCIASSLCRPLRSADRRGET